ncbi:ubiquinone biosynthesis regulatory protein kinase UbiB, partial [Xenorhabdus bovienii]|nr:ubiquinone biosynthesis regulatory protein kinase UbiB [Xenorhabdus bovienii]
VYGTLQQHRRLQVSIAQISQQFKNQQVKQRKSLYLLGIGATLFICGSLFFITGQEHLSWGLMGTGIVSWILGWRKLSKRQ